MYYLSSRSLSLSLRVRSLSLSWSWGSGPCPCPGSLGQVFVLVLWGQVLVNIPEVYWSKEVIRRWFLTWRYLKMMIIYRPTWCTNLISYTCEYVIMCIHRRPYRLTNYTHTAWMHVCGGCLWWDLWANRSQYNARCLLLMDVYEGLAIIL